MTRRSRPKPPTRNPPRSKLARKPAPKAAGKRARKPGISITRSLPRGRLRALDTRALPEDLNRISLPAGATTFIVKTSRLLTPFTLAVDATIILSDLRSAERTLDLGTGTHGLAFHINHIEEGWEHTFSLRPSSGGEVLVDHKAEAAGDDAITALALDVTAS